MLIFAHRWAVRLALLILGIGLLAGPDSGTAADDKGSIVPDADYPKLVDYQVKVLQDALKAVKEAKDKEEAKKMREKARCAAVMIAAAAQDNLGGADGPQRAALRDASIGVAGLVKQGKVDDAMKAVGELNNGKADPKAKVAKIKLFDVHIALDEVMSQFKLTKAGGLGTEKLYLNLATDKKKMIQPAGLNDNLVIAAYSTALAAELASDYVPDKNKKDWITWSGDMKKYAGELADKVKAKDGKAAFTVLNKLNTSCSVCHDKFKK
jgi:hypothetical protein